MCLEELRKDALRQGGWGRTRMIDDLPVAVMQDADGSQAEKTGQKRSRSGEQPSSSKNPGDAQPQRRRTIPLQLVAYLRSLALFFTNVMHQRRAPNSMVGTHTGLHRRLMPRSAEAF
jgi:hypothetical protein